MVSGPSSCANGQKRDEPISLGTGRIIWERIEHRYGAGDMDDATTLWLRRFTAGDERAVEALWNRYRKGLLHIARQRLGEHRRRACDEEDIALSAFKSFCLGAAAGRYPNLEDRQSFWKLLLTITLRKANTELKRQFAQKRGGGRVMGESAVGPVDDADSAHGLADLSDHGLRPDLAVMMNNECEQLLDRLRDDETLNRVALGKLEGYTNQELAARLKCSVATIERKLQRIRHAWRDQIEEGPEA